MSRACRGKPIRSPLPLWLRYSDTKGLSADLVEALVDCIVEVIELLLHLILWHDWVCELHLVDGIHDIAIFFTT